MAQIELDLSHSYVAHPQADEDYALLPLKFTFRDGGAYAVSYTHLTLPTNREG